MSASLRLELVCGSTAAPRKDIAYFKGGVHPKHVLVEKWADANRIRCSVGAHDEADGRYSDAYLYLLPRDLPRVVRMLARIRYAGDILDIVGPLTDRELKIVRGVARANRWDLRE